MIRMEVCAIVILITTSIGCGQHASKEEGAGREREVLGKRVLESCVLRENVGETAFLEVDQTQPEVGGKGLSPLEVEAAVEEVLDIFRPIVRSYYQKELESVFFWASRSKSVRPVVRRGKWSIIYRGGILDEHLTRDVVDLITCHEIGHFLGGFPMRHRPSHVFPKNSMTILASEGQADYFATKDCLVKVWKDSARNRTRVSIEIERWCAKRWGLQPDRREICARSIVAAQQFALWLDRSLVDISEPDPPATDTTYFGHGSSVCRFKTLAAGSVCDRRNDLRLIPGLIPNPETGFYGYHFEASEQHAAAYACEAGALGARPSCWFVPNEPDEYRPDDFVRCPDLGYNYNETLCEGDDLVSCSLLYFARRRCERGCDPDFLECRW